MIGNEAGKNLMVVDIIENLVSTTVKEVDKLKPKNTRQKVAKMTTLEDFNYIQNHTIHQLRKKYNG